MTCPNTSNKYSIATSRFLYCYVDTDWLLVFIYFHEARRMIRHLWPVSGDWSCPEIGTRFNITGARGWAPTHAQSRPLIGQPGAILASDWPELAPG